MSSYRFDQYEKYPILEVLGDPGSGKSLFLTYLAWMSAREGVSVFANFHLKGIPFHYIRVYTEYTFDPKTGKQKGVDTNDILSGFCEDGTPIRDGIILYDEPQTAMGKHSFYKQSTQDMAIFVSQIRKRDLALIMATQRENFPVFDVRQLVSMFFLVYKTKQKGIIDVKRFDVTGEKIIDAKRYDLRAFYTMYDSKELIGVKPE